MWITVESVSPQSIRDKEDKSLRGGREVGPMTVGDMDDRRFEVNVKDGAQEE